MKAPSLLLLSILLIIPCIGIAADRTVLCEYFTSTTCPPCKTANQYFDSWLSTFTDKNRIAVVKYHVWWPSPGNDPYYLSNTSEPRSRTSYYGVNAVPNMRIDGVNCGYTYSSWPGTITSSMAATSPLAMSISGTLNSSGGTITVSVTAENNATIPSGEIILQVALTESHLQYTGPNGDPVHESVMRKMYPDGNGEVFAIQPGQTKTFQRAIALNGGWIAANCEIVAFVQSNNVQQILQATKKSLSTLMESKTNDAMPSPVFLLTQNYPNPFNPETTIPFSLAAQGMVSLEVFDLLGRRIDILVNDLLPAGTYSRTWHAAKIPSGIYFYRLSAFSENDRQILFTQTKTLTLVK